MDITEKKQQTPAIEMQFMRKIIRIKKWEGKRNVEIREISNQKPIYIMTHGYTITKLIGACSHNEQ